MVEPVIHFDVDLELAEQMFHSFGKRFWRPCKCLCFWLVGEDPRRVIMRPFLVADIAALVAVTGQ